jgi:putative SOS response-associated peptidase YedK
MRPIHDRMPVMLTPATWDTWLDPTITDPAHLAPLLHALPADAVTKFAVSTHVSNVRHEGPACLAPASADSIADDTGPQLSLGL